MEAQIDSKAFQEIMDDFVEVHKAAGQSVDQGLLVSELRVALDSSAKKYAEFVSGLSRSCLNARAKVDSFIKRLTEARLEAQNQVKNTWANQLASGRKSATSSQASIVKVGAQLGVLQKQITQIVIDYHEGVTETDNKLHVVKQLRDIIEDELINPGQFVQIQKFNDKLKNLQELIKKSGDSLYTPIIQTLVELASEQNFSDQKILKAILSNLNQLQASLESFKKERETALNVTLKNLKAQEENLNGQLNDYHKLEQSAVSSINEANQNTVVLNTEITNLTAEIDRKNEEYKSIQHLCETEQKTFQDGTKRINLIREDLKSATNHIIDLAK
jgi:chromosome segregation ATPase